MIFQLLGVSQKFMGIPENLWSREPTARNSRSKTEPQRAAAFDWAWGR